LGTDGASINRVTPVRASVVNRLPVLLWTSISVVPSAVAAMPLMLNPGPWTKSPVSGSANGSPACLPRGKT
jgi:hypothetical protein